MVHAAYKFAFDEKKRRWKSSENKNSSARFLSPNDELIEAFHYFLHFFFTLVVFRVVGAVGINRTPEVSSEQSVTHAEINQHWSSKGNASSLEKENQGSESLYLLLIIFCRKEDSCA